MFQFNEEGSGAFVIMRADDLDKYFEKHSRKMILEARQELETIIAESKEDKLISTEEAANLLGVNRTTLWKWAKRKDYLNPIEIGGKRRYRLSDVRAIIAGRN